MDTAPRTTFSYPPSVNFHLWEPCNMRCRFCFATFQDVKQTVLPYLLAEPRRELRVREGQDGCLPKRRHHGRVCDGIGEAAAGACEGV